MIENECVFCKIASKEIDAERFFENEQFVVFKDSNPQTKGHSLVIPKEHFVTFEDLPEEYYTNFSKATKGAVTKLKEETGMQGYNFVMNNHPIAGQVMPHMHLHIIPRHAHDNIKVIK